MKKRLAGLAAALFLSVQAAAAATVSANVSAFVPGAGPNENLRLRVQSGGAEIYVGAGDLGVAANRAAAQVSYAASQGFSLVYSRAAGTLRATVGGVSATAGAAQGVTAGDVFNALLVSIRGPRGSNYFTLTGLTVNGAAIPDLAGSSAGPNTTVSFLISGIANLGGDITFSGTLNYFGTPGDNGSGVETGRVSMVLGVAPVPVPAALPLMLLALGGLGVAARRRRA